jgi:hypothetical protein
MSDAILSVAGIELGNHYADAHEQIKRNTLLRTLLQHGMLQKRGHYNFDVISLSL